jgi:hypothetical protein
MVEGPEAWKRFEGVMKSVLAVPHSEVQKRAEGDRRKSAGYPKRKAKPTAA